MLDNVEAEKSGATRTNPTESATENKPPGGKAEGRRQKAEIKTLALAHDSAFILHPSAFPFGKGETVR